MTMMRSRWAAIGAAVAVTLGAGGIGLVSATSPSGAATFVPITPCRVIDTRPDFQVGPKSTPLGPGEIVDVTATGTSGECTSVPNSATGVVLNVTAVDATLPTHLTIWETSVTQPNSSSLNPAPGQPATPNAVTTAINGSGQFSIYNLQGTVHVLADIVGYYTNHHHNDRYYTETESDERFAGRTQTAMLHWLDMEVPVGAFAGEMDGCASVDTVGYLPIVLPVGSTLVDVEVAVADSSLSATYTVSLVRRFPNAYGLWWEELASATAGTSTTPTRVEHLLAPTNPETVDADEIFEVRFDPSHPSSGALCSAAVTYVLPAST